MTNPENEFDDSVWSGAAGIGCGSIEDIEIPSAGSGFYKLTDGKNKLRFLQWPVLSFVSQEWGEDKKPIGEKKKYSYKDPAAKKDPNAKLVMTFLVYAYDKSGTGGEVKVWDIQQKSIQEKIKAINGIQPDLSAFDVQITKVEKANGYPDFQFAQWANKPFTNEEAIAEVMERGLLKRLSEMTKDEDEFGTSAEDEEKSIEAEVAAATKAAAPKAAPAAPAPTPKAAPADEVPAATVADAEEAFK